MDTRGEDSPPAIEKQHKRLQWKLLALFSMAGVSLSAPRAGKSGLEQATLLPFELACAGSGNESAELLHSSWQLSTLGGKSSCKQCKPCAEVHLVGQTPSSRLLAMPLSGSTCRWTRRRRPWPGRFCHGQGSFLFAPMFLQAAGDITSVLSVQRIFHDIVCLWVCNWVFSLAPPSAQSPVD